jgi:hypothetical protein
MTHPPDFWDYAYKKFNEWDAASDSLKELSTFFCPKDQADSLLLIQSGIDAIIQACEPGKIINGANASDEVFDLVQEILELRRSPPETWGEPLLRGFW